MGASHRSDNVKRVFDIGHPVAQRLVHGVFQRARARCDGANIGTQQFHAEHIWFLAFHVRGTHENRAGQAKARGGRCHGNAVLSSPSFGNDAGLAHTPRQQNLPQTIIYLVRSGVVQFVTLQIYFRAAIMLS